jgi:WhiB family transcriptional regulator, redox-sensing transcriptional regulator
MTNTLMDRLGADDDNDARPWSRRAVCAGKTELFYPPPGERPEARAERELRAGLVCGVCPVRKPCRDWARAHREYGFWGGESEEVRAAAGFRVRFPASTRRAKRSDPNRAA